MTPTTDHGPYQHDGVHLTPLCPRESVPGLDPGIEPLVALLREAGLSTFESCEGGDGHAYPEPTVRFGGNMAEAFLALAVALFHVQPIRALRQVWILNADGMPEGPFWEMVLRTAATAGRS